MTPKSSLAWCVAALCLALPSGPLWGQVSVLSYHNDQASTGQNLGETKLNPSNVSSATFGKIFSAAVDGQVYGQPLYVPALPVTAGTYRGTTHDTVFAVTMHDSVYAFDATSGVQLWQLSAINAAGGETSVPSGDTGTTDISPEIGITSTPVIDPTPNATTGQRYMYFVAKSRLVVNGVNHYYLRLHAVDIASGTERSGSPVVIAETTNTAGAPNSYTYVSGPSVAGSGVGTVGGRITVNALRTHQRCGLNLVNGVVYLASASHGDNGPYHGWVLGYGTAALQLTAVFNSTPNGSEGGIWMGGGIPAADASGALYVVTGNGSFANTNANTDPVVGDFDAGSFPANHDYGDSVVKLVADGSTAGSPNANGWGLKVADYFTPYNQRTLNSGDTDLGSGGPLLLPDSVGSAAHPHLLMCSGKEGRLYLLDRDNLGKFRGSVSNGAFVSTGDNIVQVSAANTITGSFDTPGYFNGKFYYLGAYNNDHGRAFGIANGVYTTAATSVTSDTFGYLSSSPTISASSATANGIVWCLDRGTNQLRAYAAANLATELYTSAQGGSSRDQLGAATKFGTVTVADGHVFVGTGESAGPSALVVYGLFAPVTTPPAQPMNLYAQTVSGGEIDLFWNDNANNESGYEVYVSTDPNNFPTTPAVTTSANATTYSVAGLQVSTTYYFHVRAVNAIGASAYSNTAASTSGVAPPIDFTNGFASAASYLTANGFGTTAPVVGSVLRVTDGGGNEAHSVWYNTAQGISQFSTEFTFQFTNATADGLTFTIQRAGLTAVGANGGGMGYQNIATSAAIKFDLYPNLSTTGLYFNGVAPNDSTTATATSSGAIDVTSAGLDFHGGHPFRATLNYDGATLTEVITDLNTHLTFTHAYTVNLTTVVGGSTAYVGFTGGTGGSASQQDVQSWSYLASFASTPKAAANLSVAASSATQFNLAWSDNSTNETSFRVERALGSASFAPVGSVGANTAVYVDSNLGTNTAYSYRVVATNAGFDASPSNVVTATTPTPPTTPSGATPTLVGTNEVDFTWVDNSNNETNFRILRQAGTGGYLTLVTLPANTTSYQDTTVQPGTEYSYHIQAFNAAGYVDFTGFEVTTVAPVNIVTSVATAQENTGTVASFAVRRSTSPDSSLTVNYTIQTGGGQAVYGTRYTLSPAPATATTGSVTIPAGATAATITVTPANDATLTGAQTVMLVLGTGAGYTVTGGSTATVTVLDTPYNTWKIQAFGSLAAAASPQAADAADYDGDGVSNLMEYALGTDPTKATNASLPSPRMETVDGGVYLTLTYKRVHPAPSDITYVAEACTNLRTPTWQSAVAVSGYPLDNGDGTETCKVRTTWSGSAYPASFIRLRITRP